MNYEGKIYRPWPEADSVLIPVTVGCTHNKCTFCDMFREKKFRMLDLDGIYADIDEARRIYSHVESIFLIDGNVLAVKTDFLLKVVEKVKETFPELKRIALYSGLNDLDRKSVEELKALKEAGVDMAYAGLESGDVPTLEFIKKGITPEEAIRGMDKAREAGIQVLVSFILGIGGRERSKEHIETTVELLNRMKPDQIAPMAMTIQPGTELERQVKSGEFIQATPRQILEEEKYLLENLGDWPMYYWGDHGNNITPMRGMMPDARDAFLKRNTEALKSHPVCNEEILKTFAW